MDVEIDWPVEQVFSYMTDMEKRQMWDNQYDFIREIGKYKMETMIYHVQVKA
jgi:hypothetical protein